MNETYLWWQRGIVYQVYPRSFQDSNADGVGDLRGITRRLDYLRWLGVDAIWISPLYPSPMKDFGYDISNYLDVHPLFGTLDDFDALVEQTHARGLKLILDYVPNHTSDQHPWFRESRRSRDNAKRDWYIWRDPAPGGGPPNNWRSNFGGPGWTLDTTTGQYYYHAFLPEQPDLNWRNPAVQDAMLAALRFWLDRGVDGFRVDVIWHLIKDEHFRDNPPNPAWTPEQRPYDAVLPVYTTDQPEVHQVIARMRRLMDEYEDRTLIGEIYLPIEKLVKYYGIGEPGAHLPFNFQLILAPWDARHIARLIDEYESQLPADGWPNWVLGNHDQHRIATRIGTDQARIAAMLLLTLRGTPTLYYGDEIGMQDVRIAPEQVQDPYERNVPGMGLGRDPERTPMQWSTAANAGFTEGEPWLPLAENAAQINVELEQQDRASILSLYRRLIELRRGEPALEVGRYQPMNADGDLLAYLREKGPRKLLVVLNFGGTPQRLSLDALSGTVLISTHLDREGEPVANTLELRPHEGVVMRLDGSPSHDGAVQPNL